MKIVCYGDSNTYGFCPIEAGLRYPEDVIWPKLLEKRLGNGNTVINEGQNGRTTAYDRPDDADGSMNGLETLPECLERHPDADLFIFMLGTNDCAFPLGLTPEEIALGMEKLALLARERTGAELLIVSPPLIGTEIGGTLFEYQIDGTSAEKSRALSALYAGLAARLGCRFADAAPCEVLKEDCEHLSRSGHRQLAEIVLRAVRGEE